jgi:Ca2+-transporting ATPase
MAEALPTKPWSRPFEDILGDLGVSADTGLDGAEVPKRLQRYGPNSLKEFKCVSPWVILTSQFKSLIVALLVAAAAVSFAFSEIVEGFAILVVIVLNAAIGYLTELRAVRSMEALRKLGTVTSKVRREGQLQEIPAEELVPGDIVVVEGGDIITADLRLIEASKLQSDESSLTGESVPVSKAVEPLEEDVPLAGRASMLFKGTSVTRGAGVGVVVATGMGTELGQIASLVEEAEEEATPLEDRLNQLGRRLIYATLIIAAIVAAGGILRGKEIFLMIETSIALAVAAIPEGLPIVATIALARGMRRMAQRNALINRLSAVETLGATNVICTDKTGTLTENRMTVMRIVNESGEIAVSGETAEKERSFTRNGESIDPQDDSMLRDILEVGVLCNNASLQHEESDGETTGVGDPLEVALLEVGAKGELDRDALLDRLPQAGEEAFDSDVKMMATYHEDRGHYLFAIKGAPEAVLKVCSHILTESDERKMTDGDRKRWSEHNERMADEGLRVLALARKAAETIESQPYEGLTFLGLYGLLDPPRGDIRGAIDLCQEAGVKLIMVTGDQPITARNIASAVGLTDSDEDEVMLGQDLKSIDELSESELQRIVRVPIFARVSPKQKLDLIDIHQSSGSIVAMTGDGVNDAPALKKADIGIAMGLRGTQVAREAADMVLRDDAFSTIVAAVEQGRIIFDNIRRFVFYLISCNVSEIMTVFLASLMNAPLPILPLQILFLNLVTDVFPALALGFGEGDPAVMKRLPRDSKEPILTRRHWISIAGYGLMITLSVLGALWLALTWLGLEKQQAVTVSFMTLAFAQMWHVFNMRDRGSGFLRNDITRNPFVLSSLGFCTCLLLAGVYIPGLAAVLKVADPGMRGWMLVGGMSLLPWVIGQILKSTHVQVRDGQD